MIGDQVPDASLHLNIDFNESLVSISNILNFCGNPLSGLSETTVDHSTDMLNTEWAELEIVELLNDRCGLGFSLMGSKSTGVVIRSIFSGSVAERNGHLRIGDHLMYIDDINVRGMTSEQVAAILRQSTDHIRLIIARPIPNCSSPEYCGSMSIIPTDQIDQHLDFLVNTLLPVSDLKAMQLYQQISVTDADQEAANIYQEHNLLQLVQTQLPPAIFQSTINTHYQTEIPMRRVAGEPESQKSEKSIEEKSLENGSSLNNINVIENNHSNTATEINFTLSVKHNDSRNIRSTSLDNDIEEANLRENELHPSRLATSASTISSPNSSKVRTKHRIRINEQNEFHEYTTYLTKGDQGLGLTIAGYITCRPEVNIHGIFVKSISKSSVADLNGQITINDQIIEINDQSVIGLDNPAVVEILKLTSGTVKLKFNRYTKGPVYEILTQTAKSSHTVSSISQSSSNSLIHTKSNSSINNSMKTTNETLTLQPMIYTILSNDESPVNNCPENIDVSVVPPSAQLANSSSEDEAEISILDFPPNQRPTMENTTKTDVLIANILPNSGFNVQKMNLKYASIDKTIEDTIKSTWNKIIGGNYDILISYINKTNEGLGISLEGTVDVDDVTGLEDKPHHYIRTITADGPIGLDGTFKSGDELLEANGKKLHGVPYQEVLTSLKSLPNRVQIVAARRKEVDVSQLSRSSSTMLYDDFIDDDDESDEYYDENDVDNDNISIDVDYHSLDQMQELFIHHPGFRSGSFLCHTDTAAKYHPKADNKIIYEDTYRYPIMSKAKSDNSIFVKSNSFSDLLPIKTLTTNRSLQYLKDVAMWSGPILVELTKESQGLGFSIEYYQDASSNVPVIVISSLVPNGVAHLDGRIIPGDRLIFINEIEVDALSSKQDVIEALQSLSKGQVLLGIAKPMFPSSYMYRSYSKETVEELSTSQSLEYEPFTLAEDAAIGSTYNSLQRVINTDVRLYQITTCIVQQTLHNAAIYLRDHCDTIVLLPCSSSELSEKELAFQSISSTRENFIDAESTVLQSSISSESSTPRREISPNSNKSDPNINLINYHNLTSSDFNNFKGELEKSCSTIRSDDEYGLKMKIISEQTSSKTPSSDINSSSSIDCLDELEVTKISESDTDAMIHYWKKSDKVESSEVKSTGIIDLNAMKKWVHLSLDKTILDLDTTKFCEVGYPLLYTSETKLNFQDICSPGDIITDINGQKLSEIRPDTINLLLSSYKKTGERIKIGYISADIYKKSSDWLPLLNSTEFTVPVTQRIYKCASNSNMENQINGQNENRNSFINLTVLQAKKSIQMSDSSIHINGWSSPRVVTVERGPNQSLGISILGGKVANVKEKEEFADDTNLVSGIFITHINPDSPAEKCGQLNIGDRLLSVNGIDLIKTSYDDAINYIKNATSPIVFTIQSLVDVSMMKDSDVMKQSNYQVSDCESHEQEPLSLNSKSETLKKKLTTPPNSPDKATNNKIIQNETDEKENSFSVSSLSNDSVTPDLSEIEAIRNGYKSSTDESGKIMNIEIDKQGKKGMGLLLVGNKDCSSMNCYICGFKDNSVAAIDGQLMIGDELLKINSIDVLGMSHSNVAPIIKKCQMESEKIMLTIKRHPDNLVKMACIPASVNTSVAPGDKLENAVEASVDEKQVSCNNNLQGYGEIFHVHLEKSVQGFGFFIMDCNANDEPGIYVKKVTVDGIAANEGTLREGDRILLINDELVVNDDYDSVLKSLRGCKNALEMVVGRLPISQDHVNNIETEPRPISKERRESIEYHMMNNPPPLQTPTVISPIINDDRKMSGVRPSISHDKEPIYSSIPPDRKRNSIQKVLNNQSITKKVSVNEQVVQEVPPTKTLTQKEHPTKAQIIPGVETVIELTKDRGLGLSIIGGSDTILGTVMIHEVHEKEAAALDGRLWAGDRILAVNGKDLRNATHDQAIQTLRSVGNRVKLKIFRDKQPLCEDSLYFKLKVDLLKKSRKGLGITIVSKSDVGVCISDLVKGSIAEQDGRLKKGDLLLEINDTNVRSFTQDQVATLLKRCSGNVFLMVGRLRSNIYSSQSSSSDKQSKRKK